jgi:PHD/YefM family antitoxin component YafN of YafNO toxin-antitoxin module
MDESTMNASDLREQWAAVLSVVAHQQQRVVVVRHGRILGALIGWKELERLRELPPAPAPLTAHERRRGAMERHAKLRLSKERVQKVLAEARERKDPLAIAHGELELEDLTAGMNAALEEATDNF